jgi:hypothetical protein
MSCRHSPGLLPLGVARKVGLRTGAPPARRPEVYPPATWEGRSLHFWPIGFTMMDTEMASPWLCTCDAKRR